MLYSESNKVQRESVHVDAGDYFRKQDSTDYKNFTVVGNCAKR